MSTGPKRTFVQAYGDAQALISLMDGSYKRWEIAGSVRRAKSEVGDVEHVVIPRIDNIPGEPTMFGEPGDHEIMNITLERLDHLEAIGEIVKAIYPNGTTRWGEKYRGFMFRGFRHEVFLCEPGNWGNILAIRTGPAEFSQRCVTNLIHRGYKQDGGYVIDPSTNPPKRYPCPEEIDFLKMCGMAWIEPEDRQ